MQDYTQYTTSWNQTDADFSTDYSYDANGNIATLLRKGVIAGTKVTIDDLSYTYLNSGKSNQLAYVQDTKGDMGQGDFRGDNSTSTDYAYDANGNMTQDINKDINSGDITYNHLNLPETIEFDNSTSKTITYTYDAAGIKLQKKVNNGGTITTTDYVGGFIYENDQLQQFAHEEGRTRLSNGSLVYDYYIKDHLGNTRMTLTEEVSVTEYRATMETEYESFEEQLFVNMDDSRTTVAGSINKTVDASITADEVASLNGSDADRRVGPGKILAISPGDSIYMEVHAYVPSGYSNSGDVGQSTLITALAGAFGGLNGGSTEQQAIYDLFDDNAASAFVGSGATNTSHPRAYLNYILFNNNFEYEDAGFEQVDGTVDAHQKITLSKKSVEGGFIYVYLSNESSANHNVYFDELSIEHHKSTILQEDHYYPFGMNINALSSTAPLSKPNKYKFGGKERQDEFDLNWDDFGSRMYDPQIGRWNHIDPKAEALHFVTPYNYALNNPLMFIDPDGEFPITFHVRSFAPFKSFGGGFHGDDRGFSTNTNGPTSRVQQKFTIETTNGAASDYRDWSDETYHTRLPRYRRTANPRGNFRPMPGEYGDGINTTSVESSYSGSNPLTPGAPNIDVFSNFDITEDVENGTVNISGTITGDNFPSTEAFVQDAAGNSVFLAVGYYEGSPFTSLWGENESKEIAKFDVTINVDKDGNFTGVAFQGNTYSLQEWNKLFENADPHRDENKN